MRKEDVKVGMKVRETNTGDIGYVTGVDEFLDSSVWVKWVITKDEYCRNQKLHIDVSCIEPVEEENLQQKDKGSFKINQKVKKVVIEVKEDESFTITLSPKAAHELRALMGSCNSDSSLRKETQDLCEYLYDEDADGLITFLGTGLLIDFDEAKTWTAWTEIR
jgi:hypothetical protein